MNPLRNASLKTRLFFFPASLVTIGLLLLWLVLYVSNSYYSLVQHLHHHDMALLSEISHMSSGFEQTNTALIRLFDEQNNNPEQAYDSAATLLDQIHQLHSQLNTISSDNRLNLNTGHAHEHISVLKLKQALESYLQTMTLTLDKYFFDPGKANSFIQAALNQSSVVEHELTNLTLRAVQQIENEVHEESERIAFIALNLILLAILIVFLTMLINIKAAKAFFRSLSGIQNGLLELAAGKLDVSIPKEHEIPEARQMSAALDSYKGTQLELRQALSSLSKVKSELETRVTKRTRQLENSNQELHHEVAQHKRAQEQLKIYAQALHSTSEAVVITDADNLIVEVNDAFCQITGYSRADIIGKSPGAFKSGQHDKAFFQQMWADIQNKGHWKGEIWDRRKNGEVYPKWLNINTVVDENHQVTNYVGVFTDISDQKDKEAQLERLAHFDPLTLLPNRVLCRERIMQKLNLAKRSGHKVAILFIDLDRFKLINDSLGHEAGDQLLKVVSDRLENSLRAEDLMLPLEQQLNHTIARLGGDEFIISLGNLPAVEYVADIVERIQETINTPIHLCGREVSVDSSIGVAIYPDDGDNYDTLCRHADTAMYRAKEAGRGQFVLFTEQMNIQAHQRLQLEIEMKQSLAARQFELYYQPKICADTGLIHSFEALIRWNHPDLGLITPDQFIEVAEETGMIIPLGSWILEQACRFCAQLNAEQPGNELQIAVNLSTRQFKAPNLLGQIKEALLTSQLPPHYLELEITESAIFGDINEAITTINAIRAMGVSFALDDFGTGYSSLNYLKRLPVNTLKIDKSFVSHLDDQSASDDRSIVETVVLLGQQFALKTVAEGVENQIQAHYLKTLGCDYLQGYHFSKPLPESAFIQYLKAHHAQQTV